MQSPLLLGLLLWAGCAAGFNTKVISHDYAVYGVNDRFYAGVNAEVIAAIQQLTAVFLGILLLCALALIALRHRRLPRVSALRGE